MTTSTTKRKTTARKPAAKRAARAVGNGQANGHTPEVRPPEEFVPREPGEAPAAPEPETPGVPAIDGMPSHPFGDRQIQMFKSSTGDMIVVPHISTVEVTELFLWENHKQNLDLMQQSWRWMDLAGIPDEIQRQVVSLPPGDKRLFWESWFAGFTPPPTGEPPGES